MSKNHQASSMNSFQIPSDLHTQFPEGEHVFIGLTGAELDLLMDNHFSHMIDVLNDGIFYMNDRDNVCFYNPSFYSRFGIAPGHTHLSQWINLIHPQDQHVFKGEVEAHILQNGTRMTTQYRVRCKNGQYIWLEGTAITKTVNGQRFMIGCHRDISDRKLMESYVKQSSLMDNSSGLSNEQKLALDLETLNIDTEHSYHLMYIQPGATRSYQTLYGSQLMRNLLSHLTSMLGEFPDYFVDFYRIQSHDFAVLIRGDYSESALHDLAARIYDAYQESIKVIEFLGAANISIGIYPNITCDVPTDEIVRVAAQTSQYANHKREDGIRTYSGVTKQKVDRHFFIERELGNAIQNDKLSVKFQPIICSKSLDVASFESLVRWRCPQMGEIYPDEFIHIAEAKGFISELGYFVFEKACQFINEYKSNNNKNIKVNVNVSVLQLLTKHFPENIKQLAEKYRIDSDTIILELTETIILDDNKNAIEQLNRLKSFGFKLSLDDFGAGHSSLKGFFDLPLSQIKIDKSIAWRSLNNSATFEYLSFITKLCKAHNIDIVIEGIENAEMQQIFIKMGASYLQGFLFSKPLSLASACRYNKV